MHPQHPETTDSTSAGPATPDWQRTRERVATLPWAAEIIEAIRADAGYWRPRLAIPGPDQLSDWTHHYFCDDDGTRLVFDPQTPTSHRCPTCDRVYSGEPKDGAWRTTMHNLVVAQAQRDALIIRCVDDPEEVAAAQQELETIVGHYGTHYAEYPEHGKNAGTGKVMPQCLDEAISVIGLLRSTRWTEDLLSGEVVAAAERLAAGAVSLLQPQVSKIHNIHCWMLAALAECAIRLDDDALLTFCRDSEYGVAAQLQRGFRPEGLWWEVNPHYHYYTVQSLLCWAEAAGPQSLTPEMAETLRRAVTAPARLAYRDGLLPAYGDGWPATWLPMFAAHAEAATGLIPPEQIDAEQIDGEQIDLTPFYAGAGDEAVKLWGGAPAPTEQSPLCTAGRPSVAALLFGPDELPVIEQSEPQSFFWPGPGIAVLHGAGTRIALRSGPDAGGHDHCDKLAVDIETPSGWRSLDLGTSGYGAEFTKWLRSPAAHSTVFIGGDRQPHCDGEIIEFSDQHALGSTEWDGVRLRRRIELVPDGWTDVFEIDLDHEDDIDWVFHGDGLIRTDAEQTPLSSAPSEDDALGRTFLRNPLQVEADSGKLRFRWDLAGSPQVGIELPTGFSALAAEADGNPSGHPLGTMIISGRARHAVISARFWT